MIRPSTQSCCLEGRETHPCTAPVEFALAALLDILVALLLLGLDVLLHVACALLPLLGRLGLDLLDPLDLLLDKLDVVHNLHVV